MIKKMRVALYVRMEAFRYFFWVMESNWQMLNYNRLIDYCDKIIVQIVKTNSIQSFYYFLFELINNWYTYKIDQLCTQLIIYIRAKYKPTKSNCLIIRYLFLLLQFFMVKFQKTFGSIIFPTLFRDLVHHFVPLFDKG